MYTLKMECSWCSHGKQPDSEKHINKKHMKANLTYAVHWIIHLQILSDKNLPVYTFWCICELLLYV